MAPLDVQLSARNVLQPDIVFVSREKEGMIDLSAGIKGGPDLVVEVTSPGSETYDRHEKLDIYAAAGVPEYWIVSPEARTVELLVYTPKTRRLMTQAVLRGSATIPTQILPGFPTPVEKFSA